MEVFISARVFGEVVQHRQNGVGNHTDYQNVSCALFFYLIYPSHGDMMIMLLEFTAHL